MQATQQMPVCPISGKAMRHWMSMPIDSITTKTQPYNQLYWCDDSQYGAVIPSPDPETLRKFYDLDKYYTHGADHLSGTEKVSLLDKVRLNIAWRFEGGIFIEPNYIHNILCQQQPKDILEIGSGAGNLLAQLNQLGHRVFGVEPDPNAAAFTKGLEVYQGTAEDIPEAVKSKTFDVVIMNHVLEHCIDPVKAVANITSVLRPGGKYMCVVPNNAAHCLQEAGVTWQFLDVPRHLHFFTAKSLQGICQKSGLTIESTFYNSYCRQFNNTWIDTEIKIWEGIKASGLEAHPMPASKMSKTRAWQRMLTTLFATPEKRYECVGVIASKK